MKGFRISKSREEIINVLQRKFEAEVHLTLWQKDPKSGERKLKCNVLFSKIDVNEGYFSINIHKEDLTHFNPNLDTYFLINEQDFVFKTKTSLIKSEVLTAINFQIPHDVRLKELRINPRTYINQDEKRFVSAVFTAIENKENVSVACPIYNISVTGICIIITRETLSSIQLGEIIQIEGLSFFQSLKNAQTAIVRNARVFSKKGLNTDEHYALGLEFQD